MKIYFAGNTGIKKRERELQTKVINRLLSYWDIEIETHRAGPFAMNLMMNKEK